MATSTRKGPTKAERLQHLCPQCFAAPGQPCTEGNSNLVADGLHHDRGRPEAARKRAQDKADRTNTRQLASYGPLFQEIAEKEVPRLTAEDIFEERRRNAAFAPDAGGPVGMLLTNQANRGLEWVRLEWIRRGVTEIVGEFWGSALWEYARRVYGSKTDCIESFFCDCLCTMSSKQLKVTFEVNEGPPKTIELGNCVDPSKPNFFALRGGKLVPELSWPPPLTAPVMTRDEFRRRWPALDHHKGIQGGMEPDDGGLFNAIATLGRRKVAS